MEATYPIEGDRFREIKRKLQLVQAVYDRPGTDGEKQAAALAIARLRQRLQGMQRYEAVRIRKPVFTVFDKV
jgi:hypothetical protein